MMQDNAEILAIPPMEPRENSMLVQQALIADWFAGVFIAPPGKAFVEQARSDQTTALICELGEMLNCIEASATMSAALHDGSVAQVTCNLGRSYTTLFEGVSGPRTVPLCESGYFGDGHRLFREPYSEMNATLRRLDMSVSDEIVEPSDHVAIELAALGCAMRQSDFVEMTRLQKRLETWTPKLRAEIVSKDTSKFYAAASTLLVAFLPVLARPELTDVARTIVDFQ